MKGFVTQTLLALIYWPWAKLKEFVSGLFSDDAEQTEKAQQGEVSGDGSGHPLPEVSQEERVYDPAIGQVRKPPIGGHATRVYEGAAQFELNHALWKELSKDDQWSWEEAIREADHDQMVKFYSDDALRKIAEWGTLFAFSDDVAASINDAAGREYSRRYPTRAPKGHGMGPNGGQA
jgi:hypothetical protein